MPDREMLMKRAIAVALQNPECPFGALLVDSRSGEVVAEGYNRTLANPTWHGEIDAINRYAGISAGNDYSHLHLYTTAEPCCMCQGAILWAGIPVVYYGISIDGLKQLGWKQIDIGSCEIVARTPFARCEIEGGILLDDCRRLFQAAGELEVAPTGKRA